MPPDQQSLDDRVLDALRSLGEPVLGFEVHSGRDADGEPATWVWLVLPDDPLAWSWENRESLRSQVLELLRTAGIPHWVFVRFRGVTELAKAS